MGRKTRGSRDYFKDSLRKNNATYMMYVHRLMELSMAMFEWKNLPDTVDPRFLEMILFTDGKALFFEDEVLGFLVLQFTNNGRFDVYRVPMGRRAFAVNAYQKNCDSMDSVIIWNNYLRTNSYLDVVMFAERLYNIDRIIDVNVNAQKTPVLIQCSDTQRLTMSNLYMQYDGNAPVIFGDKNLDINALKVLNTEAPYVADKLYELKTRIWNEALTYLGISNLSVQKKERLVSDEVVRSQGGTIASRYSRLQARREAAHKINIMFGLDIQVDFREDYRELDDEYMIEDEEGNLKLDPMVVDLRTKSPIKQAGGL